MFTFFCGPLCVAEMPSVELWADIFMYAFFICYGQNSVVCLVRAILLFKDTWCTVLSVCPETTSVACSGLNPNTLKLTQSRAVLIFLNRI